MKNIALVWMLALTITGCASMADVTSKIAGVGVISEEKSTFDNATIVSMSPAWLYAEGEWLGVPVKLGARWSSNSPDYVALIMSYSSNTYGSSSSLYTNFSGIDLNIDGKITSYKATGLTNHSNSGYNTVSKTIYTDSKSSVVIPLKVLKEMLVAKDTRLRINTGDGYVDAQFSIERIPGGQGAAILTMREFVAKVDSKIANP